MPLVSQAFSWEQPRGSQVWVGASSGGEQELHLALLAPGCLMTEMVLTWFAGSEATVRRGEARHVKQREWTKSRSDEVIAARWRRRCLCKSWH